MMKKLARIVLAAFLSVMIVFSLAGCGDKTIVGTWKGSEMGLSTIIEFTKDGHMSVTAMGLLAESGTYRLEGEYIALKPDSKDEEKKLPFSLDGDTLVLEGTTYLRQKD